MAKFIVKKDGKKVGVLYGRDARDLGMEAVSRFGYGGEYQIKLVRGSEHINSERDEEE